MNFAEALETKVSDVAPPARQPQGTYIWAVTKVPTIEEIKSAKGEWDVVNFPIHAISAENDVDEDDLAEFGSLKAARNRISFMFPTDPDEENARQETLDRMTKFLTDILQIDAGPDASVKELLAESVNCQFMALAKWRVDGDRVFIDVKEYAPV